MADEALHFDSSLPVKYNRAIREVYFDTVGFFGNVSGGGEAKAIQAVHLSSIVRRLLKRQSKSIPYVARFFDTRTYLWYFGWDGLAAFIPLAIDSIGWARDCIISGKSSRTVMFWESSGRENISDWLADDHDSSSMSSVKVRGPIAGQITKIGPSYSAVTAHESASRMWAKALPAALWAQNKRLMTMLFSYHGLSDMSTFPIMGEASSLCVPQPLNQEDEGTSPVLFIGTNGILGISPQSARASDLVVQFWKSSSSAVVREHEDGCLQVIGRSGIIQYGDSLDWDMPLDEGAFVVSSLGSIELDVDMNSLTRLALNTVAMEESVDDGELW